MQQVTVEHHGKQITATLSKGQWFVTISGTALTKFPAAPGETEDTVRRRVVQWLEAHPDMLDRDQIVLGGG
jgi:hypothetical protein